MDMNIVVNWGLLFFWIFALDYPPKQQGEANMLLVRPGKEQYGPVYFNSTTFNFTLTNHLPEDLDGAVPNLDLFPGPAKGPDYEE